MVTDGSGWNAELRDIPWVHYALRAAGLDNRACLGATDTYIRDSHCPRNDLFAAALLYRLQKYRADGFTA